MTVEEVEGFIEDCIAAAVRSQRAGSRWRSAHGASRLSTRTVSKPPVQSTR